MTVETRERIAEPEVRVKTVPDVLRHAALVIEERGWCQHALEDLDGRVCLLGSVNLASTGAALTMPDKGGPIWLALWNALDAPSLADWNNEPERTAAEVTAALRAAADAYESVR